MVLWVPNLVIQKLKKKDTSRVIDTNEANVAQYFQELGQLLNAHDLKNQP